MSNITDSQIDIFSLDIAIGLLKSKKEKDQLKPPEISFLSTSLNLYLRYCEDTLNSKPKARNLDSFLESNLVSDLEKIREYLKRNNGSGEVDLLQESQSNTPEKEGNSIPVTLETMRASFDANQEILSKAKKSKNSVAETVKRARKTWNDRRKIELIYENAAKENKELEEKRQAEIDKYYISAVDSKAKSKADITQNTTKLIYYSLLSKKESGSLSKVDFDRSVQDILYLAETGAIDIDDYRQLNIATELTLKDNLKNYQSEFDYVDKLVDKRNKLEAENPYNEEIDAIEEIIDYSDEENYQDINGTTKKFVQGLASKYQDYDVLTLEAKKEADKITNGLSKSIPNPEFLFGQTSELDKYSQELENAIRETDPKALNAYPESIGARTVGIISVTGGDKRISAPAVKLFSEGLTTKKLEELESLPNSKLRELLDKNREVANQIRFQLKELQNKNNKLGVEISNNFRPAVGLINNLSPTAQKILNPYQSIKSSVYKRIGQGIGSTVIKNSSSSFSKKIGEYIFRDGLKAGVKNFTNEAVKKGAAKVITWAAVKLGVSMSAESLNAIVPGLGIVVDIAAQVVLWLGEKTVGLIYKGFNSIYRDLWGEDFSIKNAVRESAVGVGALLAGSLLLKNAIGSVVVSTRAAVISAAGILWLSAATLAVFLTLTFMVAPLLSTLVQFDSEEKVQYLEPVVDPDDQTAECGSGTVTNDKSTCRGNYCFPVADKSKVSYLTYHHDYPAQDIMRIGDKPGSQDDVPLAILAYTSGTIVNMNDGTGGLSVYLAGDDGRFYWFTHLSKTTTTGGIKVKAGDIIGCMGTSGNAEGYLQHLHFHISTKPNMITVPENYPNFIWPYQDFCRTVGVCGSLNPEQYPEYQYL